MRILLFILFLFISVPAQAKTLDYTDFREVPVLHEGRIKPLESYARAYLKSFHGRDTIDDMDATQWLAETLFDHDKAYDRKLFNISNPDVLHALGMQWRDKHRYSFNETITAIDRSNDLLNAIYNTPPEKRSLVQQQLLDLYYMTVTYGEISRALLPSGDAKSILGRDQRAEAFRIVPPQWTGQDDTWMSPYSTLDRGMGSPQSAAYLETWNNLKDAYANNNREKWAVQSAKVKDMAHSLAGEQLSPQRLKLEVLYLQLDLFTLSLAVYMAAFLMLMVWFFTMKKPLYTLSFATVFAAAFMQLCALVMRMVILWRPPVSTLYETTIFVSLIAVILCLIFEWKRRDGMVLLTASLIGSILLFISTRYAADGDTMQMLVAVLNTNFWLATHVVTITMGYGCTLVAGTLAHIYLIRRAWNKEKDRLFQTTQAVALIALFFCILGTILGGIWADQSWGRFWGWDPKENGAMLICLWLLWVLHGRITGMLNALNFMSLMVVANIIVALAWFGVNLLSVGLHSYGFTDGIAINLGLFCAAEIIFILAMRGRIYLQGDKA